ncbi:2-oxoglutarate dehydrogenase E1 component [Quadrisphaera granulorum]|uniref:2-oxoglutarate dehydrogenase E1 component n=1 Tax=Quadrisphaera granulorum TaxID=317664 RepID=A0A316AD22_9ACTN|nr:multifunctional oxoglutarate decarboxylase/oxoglutarate dehydrogenase thiamine pyrophosphate-binding subunit/dihydrolipoyllysine-residue succinyltransferase subunit [Quadrisphaera granulorum]PWJ54870.1 2-oxoglutarate dehydrogenase E1 component [Quadrisphaera granulorum]SZE95816.1 2-oxoglutarate dehydrogenase E1 component [Quadrisphaera granulorum]
MTQTPTTGGRQDGPGFDPAAAFGANEWLVEDLYQQYLRDRTAVDPAWWDFFAGYADNGAGNGSGTGNGSSSPSNGTSSNGSGNGSSSSSAAAPAAKAAPAAPAAPVKPPQPAAAAKTAPAKAPASSTDAPAVPGAPGPSRPAERPAPRSGTPTPAQAAPKTPAPAPTSADEQPTSVRLRGPAARVVTNMEASLSVPTATSVRTVPAKLLIDNRIVINNHLKRARGGKVSFTHLIGYAVVEALREMPEMNWAYTEVDGKPGILQPPHVNFGLAIDLPAKDGSRQLLVPSIKKAETLDFAHFWAAYEDLVRRARSGGLGVPDFAGTTISLTNPGTIGTVHSVPRLVQGQGTIIGVGAMDYPAEYSGASAETLARLAVSKTLTLTSTYDHRIIQGAQSGEFLRLIHGKLLGDDFWDGIFTALRIPYEPVRWVQDISISHDDEIGKTARVVELVHAYRVRGHLMADTDPLEYRQRRHYDLDIRNHGLTLWDLDREFPTGGFGGKPLMKLRDILGVLRDSYCRTVGLEYMHIQDPAQRRWIQDRVERPYTPLSREGHLRVLKRLNDAEAFETFLQTKYVGQKRFSLEGAESVIPLLDAVLSEAAHAGIEEVGIGMAHRGRLNVLANIAGKSYSQIFREFEGVQDPRSVQGSGDVKYHLGTEGVFTSQDGTQTKVYLAANPSHLEAVDPVLEGIVRAKQDRINLGGSRFPVLPVLVHGDAAFAGQGVVAETLNLSQLRGYRTGGTVHVVINNQVGFTTAPASSRSSFYCTDVARMVQAPIFHVNGDDPEACVRVAKLAFAFREEFAKDVVIDMVCYRRRGHNEGDDPSMTQPLMYGLIEAKRSTRKLYTEALIGRGDITVEEAEKVLDDYRQQLERAFEETKDGAEPRAVTSGEASDSSSTTAGLDRPASQRDESVADPSRTEIDEQLFRAIGEAHVEMPDGFTVHPKLKPMLDKRAQMTREGGVDWAMGELLAIGSLLSEGTGVRLAGQDSRRGTFAQRHAVLIDRVTGEEWTPLQKFATGDARFWVYDSLLSEYAAMGFEYGYSVERPDALVMWEAQFGDFAGGAQTIIDEFISSSQQKWSQRSSVVLLLPHGYEGQGPDHSSARIERFLQLCAEENMTVAMPSTPASHFHLLRRQAYQRPRRPLVVFTPKSMLRLKAASSPVSAFTEGGFQTVLGDDPRAIDAASVDRVLLCSGKVTYDLLAERERRGDRRTAVVRLEQLYPLDGRVLREVLSAFPASAELVWVQEEPANQGAWPFLGYAFAEALADRAVRRVSRPASASPATGRSKAHAVEQKALVAEALDR